MSTKYLIGIDAGTSNVKSVLYTLDGTEVGISIRDNTVHTDDLKSYQDMNLLWEDVKSTLKDIISRYDVRSGEVIGIGVTGQGEGLWILDDDGEPIQDAILWNDGRSLETLDKIKSDKKLYYNIKLSVGSYIRTGSTLTLIKWLKENNPGAYEKTATIFSCKDWIRYKLTRNINWELSDATCSCVELNSKKYAHEIFSMLGLENLAEKLPPLVKATDNCGIVVDDVAHELGIGENVPVSGGMIDIVSSAAGTGAVNEKDVCVILGTTGMTFSVLDKYLADGRYNGWEVHIDGMTYIKGMGTMAATPNLDWLIKNMSFENEESLVEINNKLADYKPFDSGVLYLPHISNAGERAPFFSPLATAQFSGICESTTPYDLVHAVMEGVGLSIKDCLREVKDMKKVFLSGGGAKSTIWPQIIADMLNSDLFISEGKEMGAKGAALSAAIMTGYISLGEGLEKSFCRVDKIYHPIEKNVKEYEELYQVYKEVQKHAIDFWEFRNKKRSIRSW